VMDYAAISYPAPGNPGGVHVQTELGPYDFLAIEWGYKQLTGATPEARRAELDAVAARVGEPGGEFATDEELGGMDPYVSHFDLGPEPLEYAERELARIARRWAEMEAEERPAGTDYRELSREFWLIYRSYFQTLVGLIPPYVGGMRYRRTRVGQNAGRPPYEAVPIEKQRDALRLLNRVLFSDEALRFSPRFLARLAPENLETVDDLSPDVPQMAFARTVTALRERVLRRLLEPARLYRIVENRLLLAEGQKPLTMHQLFETLEHMLWSEYMPSQGKEPVYASASPLRRDQQITHLELLIELADEDDKLGELPPEAVRSAHASLLRIRWHLQRALKRGKLPHGDKEHIRHALRRIKTVLEAD
jgi:hypothetical protein